MEVETDALSSPPRPTGAASEDTEGPKSDGHLEQNDPLKTSPVQPRDKIPVEVDAVPTAARTCNTSRATEAEPENKEQVDLNGGIPKPSLSHDENKTRKGCKHKSSRSSSENSSRPQNSKSRTGPGNLQTFTTNLKVIGCTNVNFGTVQNYYPMIPRSSNEQENDEIQTKSRKTQYKKLLSCQKELTVNDMIIISENMIEKGLRYLSKLLLDENEVGVIEKEHREKGQKEVTYQTLAMWKCHNSGNDLTPMLNLICAALLHKKVYDYGGNKALEGLQKYHFGVDG